MFDYIKEFYQKMGQVETFENLQKAAISSKRRKITKMIVGSLVNSGEIDTILEIGPGSGYITQGVCDILEENKKVNLDIMDFSDGFIQSTKNLNPQINNAYIADISSLDFHVGKQYDLILFQEVIEHLTCPYVAVNNINGLLNSNGYLFLTLPNTTHYRNILRTIKLTKSKGSVSLKNTHINELSILGVIKLLSMTGFKIVKTHFYGSSIPFVDVFLSQQVGFLAKKVSSPKESWIELETITLKT